VTGVRDTPALSRAALAGLPATLAMDLGRWVAHMRRGRFRHTEIATAPAVRGEAAIGIATHYAIGLTLGAGYWLLLRAASTPRSSIPLALAYGTATTVFSWS